MPDSLVKILLIGFGNPGRLDDGLGPALAAQAETWDIQGLTVDANYQLAVEDAHEVSLHDVVVFADAAEKGPEPFFFQPIFGKPGMTFSSHAVEPEAVLGMAEEYFGKKVEAYMLGIRGYTFDEFGEGHSVQAAANLDAALHFLEPVLRQRSFREVVDAQPTFEELS